jgi:hypothetical protein
MRKLIIVPYFSNESVGVLPKWTSQFLACTNKLKSYGWDFLILTDREDFNRRALEMLGVVPGWSYIRKPTDFFPMFGIMFADCLLDYDYWGYSGMDEVFGRVDRFIPDEELQKLDVWSADSNMLCGPLTLYRNSPVVNKLFMTDPNWKHILEDTNYYGYDEQGFDTIVKQSPLNVGFYLCHSWDKMPEHNPTPKLRLDPDGTLLDLAHHKEIAFFHFNRMQEWPL